MAFFKIHGTCIFSNGDSLDLSKAKGRSVDGFVLEKIDSIINSGIYHRCILENIVNWNMVEKYK
jgi:hypothetical protein